MRGEINWAAHIEAVARRLCGEPNKQLSSKEELRFGRKGSLRVSIAGPHKGTWKDWEGGAKGGVLALIEHKLGMSLRDAAEWAKVELHIDEPPQPPPQHPATDDPGRVVAAYYYHDEAGQVLYRVRRREYKDGSKTFVQNPPDGNGGWVRGQGCMNGVRRVPYHLPELIEDAERTAFVVEGEKCADRLHELGLLATSNSGGCGETKLWAGFTEFFRARTVIVLPDNDDGGRRHAIGVVNYLLPAATEVRLLELPDLPEKGDVFDWLEAGHTKEELLALAEAAEPVREALPLPPKESNVVPLRVAQAQQGRGLPAIEIEGGDLSDIVDQVDKLVLKHDREIFQRGGMLVRPVLEPIDIRNGQKTMAWRVAKIEKIHLIDRLTRVIDFQQYNRTKKERVSKDCPEKVAGAYLERTGSWSVPIIAGITDAPTMRPDGTVIETPGYDAATGVLYKPGLDYAPLQKTPTREHAVAALKLLCDLVSEFPFVDADGNDAKDKPSASRSVALSFMLTVCARYAIGKVPLHGFDAPVPGSGKSLLVDCASMIVTGHESASMGTGQTEEEFEKRLGSALLAGDPIINLDNVDTPLGGEMLCRCLTQAFVKVRILGMSKQPEIACSTIFSANGNNLVMKGDVTRRAIVARLDPKMERPEERDFKASPLETIKENRAIYVRACLTILRAFVVAGRPKQDHKPLGSYEEWSNLIRDALVWLGEPDPVKTMENVRSADPVLGSLNEVLAQWYAVATAESFVAVTAKRLIEVATATEKVADASVDGPAQYTLKHPDLRDALLSVSGDQRGNINSVALGKWLARNKGRVVNGLLIENGREKAMGGLVRWTVTKVTRVG